MSTIFASVAEAVSKVVGKIPYFLWALLILVAGWILALVISKAVGVWVSKTSLDKKVSDIVEDDASMKHLTMEHWLSKAVFYFLMLIVFVCFFQALNLAAATVPLNELLTKVFNYIPHLISAVILIIAAWIIASLIRTILFKVLSKANIDKKLAEKADLSQKSVIPMSKTIADASYWLVFLFFIPFILETLKLKEGLLGPISNMFDKVLTFIPQVLGASLILVVGWFIAKIIQKIVTNLLASFETDQLSDKVGLSKILGNQKLSKALGTVAYVLVILMALIAALQHLSLDAISIPLSEMLKKVVLAAPNIFYAFVIIIVAYVVGRLISDLIRDLLGGFGFNMILVKLGIGKEPVEGELTPSEVIGKLAMVGIVFFAVIEACARLGFTVLASVGEKFMVFAGQVILGVIIFGIGLYFANLAFTLLKGKSGKSDMLAYAVRICILVFAGAMALNRMEFGTEIINMAFTLLIGAIAVAVAVAFGIGGRDFAAKKLEEWEKAVKEKK